MKQAALVLALVGILALIGCLSENTQDRFTVGMDLLYEGRYQDAESHFLVLARELSRSSDESARIWRARALYQAGRVEHLYLDQPRRAVARLREALKLTPHGKFSFDARREIALIFHDKLKDYRSAALEFERLVQAFPDRKGIEQYQYRIAQSYFVLREFSQARTEARLLLEKHPASPLWADTMLLVANSFYVEARFQESAEVHKQLLSKHPGEEIESRSLFELGMCYAELGDYKKAEENLLMALKMHPRPDIVQLQLASLKDRQNEEGTKSKTVLPYATAGRHGSGVKKKTAPPPPKKKTLPKEPKKTTGKKPPPPPAEEAIKVGEEKAPQPKKEAPPPKKETPKPVAPQAEEKPVPKAPVKKTLNKPPAKTAPATGPAQEKPAE
jgi:tetratricopeptide (TPR) repeat protein